MAESGTRAPEMGFAHEALYAVIYGSIVLFVLAGGMWLSLTSSADALLRRHSLLPHEGWCIAWVAVIKNLQFVKEILSIETLDASGYSVPAATHARNLTAKT